VIEIKRRVEEEGKLKQEEGEKKEREQFEQEQQEQKEEERAMAALLRLAQDADECLTSGAGAEGCDRKEREEDEAEEHDLDAEAFLSGNPSGGAKHQRAAFFGVHVEHQRSWTMMGRRTCMAAA
jgi:hypothetical protein